MTNATMGRKLETFCFVNTTCSMQNLNTHSQTKKYFRDRQVDERYIFGSPVF